MPTFNPGTIKNVVSPISGSEYSVIEMKVLRNLRHQSLGIAFSATPDNPKQVAGGGTAIFRTQQYRQVGDYTKANMYDQSELVESEVKIAVSAGNSKTIKWQQESLDNAGIQPATRDAFLGQIAAGVSLTLTIYLDSVWLEVGYKAAVAEFKKGRTSAFAVNADWLDLNTETLRIDAYRQASRAKIALTRELDKYNMGSNFDKYGAIIHAYITNDFSLVIAKPGGGNAATSTMRKLTTGSQVYAGLGEVKDHLLLGKTVTAGSLYTKDRNFEFKNLVGVIAHDESLFVALWGMSVVSRINRAGNVEYITKFGTFEGVVRPELICALTIANPSDQDTLDTVTDGDLQANLIAQTKIDKTKAADDAANVKPADYTATINALAGIGVHFTTWTIDAGAKTITYIATLSKTGLNPVTINGVITGFL